MFFTRRHLLYSMLGALGLAALSGVLALLMSDTGAVWRVAGTSFAAAIAAAIMIPMAGWADKPLTRLAGLLGMGVAVGELGLAALLIWGDFFPRDVYEFLALSVAILGIGGLISVRFLKEMGVPSRVWMARVGCAASVLSSLLFFVAAYEASFTGASLAEEFAVTAWAVFGAGTLAAFALLGFEPPQRDDRPWRWVGVVAAMGAMAMTFYGIWMSKGGDPSWIVAASCVAAVVAHAIGCLRLRLTPVQSWVRVTAIAAAACTGAFCTFASVFDSNWRLFDDFAWEWRGTAAFGLICVSATMALIVFGRLNRKPVVELARAVKFELVTLFCPRCEKKLVLPVGGALCDSCRLHISVTVQTARCAKCNYDLVDLRAGVCPECGEPIPTGSTGLSDAT